MSQRRGSANVFGMLFVISLLGNLVMGLMLAGCSLLPSLTPDTPSSVRKDASLTHLKEIARRLEVEVSPNAEAVDVVTPIIIAINEAKVSVPRPLSETASKTSMAVLGNEDKELFLKQKAFLESLQGKRVLVFPAKEK